MTHEVTRSVELDAAPEAVWDLLVDEEARAAWLDDEDAAAREVRVDREDPGRSLAWTWWRPDDPAGASQVEVVLDEGPEGRTRLVVTERLLVPAPTAGGLRAEASVAPVASAATWDRRLLGLELLVVAAGALVL
ncbi:MAG TPA: hypothetical protein VIL36_02455 [Acidimicrobiales bacterium]